MQPGRAKRWSIVAALVAILAALPYAVGQLPAGGATVAAPQLLSRIQASSGVGYSGYAESTGDLALPVTSGQFSSLVDLFGATTQLRVWWRSSRAWRVDSISPSGEQDLHGIGTDLWTWNYESGSSVQLDRFATGVQARLPRADDLVPAELARRLLSQAEPSEVATIDSARIAGHDAVGLRYTPNAAASTIDHVDVWALADSGLPVKVAVYAKGDSTPVVETAMLDLDVSTPSAATIAFTPPPGVQVRTQQAPDVLALAGRIPGQNAPATAGGLARDAVSPAGSSVTVYGSGVTVLIAIPIFGRTGDQLRDQLTKAVGSTVSDAGVANSVGPVNLLLTNRVFSQLSRGLSWLLVGTVTPQTLQAAQADFNAKGL